MSRPFRFKRFTVTQERAAMKVGTDGVLLGAWCTVRPAMHRALDIGTGTGLIALMLAQRGEQWGLSVDAVEPEEGAFADAAANAAASPWPEFIKVRSKTLQEFTAGYAGMPYDLIACNPPYFSSSLLPPETGRSTARHDVSLDREELITCSAALSHAGTIFALIIPYEQAGDYITSGDLKGFSLTRRTDVRTTPATAPKRTLLEFVYGPSESTARWSELTVEHSPLHYTEEYMELTKDFYLKF